MLENSGSNQDTNLFEKNQFLWVFLHYIPGFTVIHEVTISVKSVENIGQLVDKILTKPGITLKNFEWKAI